jgi:hypothetical protein
MREGPLTVVRCIGCRHLQSESYQVQKDSGTDYWCGNPHIITLPLNERYIGDSDTTTPDWCPVLDQRGLG